MVPRSFENATAFSITTLCITTHSIKTLSIKDLFATFSINGTQHNSTLIVIMLNVAFYLVLCWMSLELMSLCWMSLWVERQLVEAALGQLITTSGIWSTIYKLVNGITLCFDQFVYSRPNATSGNKSTNCRLWQLVEYKDIVYSTNWMLNVNMLNVVMLSVVAPFWKHQPWLIILAFAKYNHRFNVFIS
jgi:hypothetical protein